MLPELTLGCPQHHRMHSCAAHHRKGARPPTVIDVRQHDTFHRIGGGKGYFAYAQTEELFEIFFGMRSFLKKSFSSPPFPSLPFLIPTLLLIYIKGILLGCV